ncbi:MAG TPA: hypothetical protein VGB02_03700 [Pyrinomonadaceae bacterium]|jgi:hypothetical protein
MPREAQITELLKWDPDWVADPVPPWLLIGLDKAILRELALISLERQKAIQEVNIRTIDRATEVIKRAK